MSTHRWPVDDQQFCSAPGDAHPGNAARIDVSTLILLAQLRAKTHALCDARDIGNSGY